MKQLNIPGIVYTFGQAIRWARLAQGITLRQLATEVGVTPSFICDLEKDRRQTNRVIEFAAALGVTVEELECRQGVTEDLTDWLSKHPELIKEIRDIRAGRRVRLRRKR